MAEQTAFNHIECVVVDIEGTTSQTAFVFDVLFPYARSRFAQWVANANSDALLHVFELTGLAGPQLVAQLEAWSDADEKSSPLKYVQGQIWGEGFKRGELASHLFADVSPALSAWKADGLRLSVFSSGSVVAQQSWFANTEAGDLAELFENFFDTENAGAKREVSSYLRIAQALDLEPSQIVFLTDVPEEVAAALQAGWQVAPIAREGEPHAQRLRDAYPTFSSFAEISINRT